MKKLMASFFVGFTVLCFSCGNKDAAAVIKLQKDSFAAIGEAIAKANEESGNLMFSKGGAAVSEIYIDDYRISGTGRHAELSDFLEKAVNSRLGIKTVFIDDAKAKELKYSYILKNILGENSDLTLINLKIDEKNIEAASPDIYAKSFFIPVKGWGKFMKLLDPSFLGKFDDLNFSYSAIKKFYEFKADNPTRKRYDKAMQKKYAHALIKKTDDGYFIELNKDDVKESNNLFLYAIRNDNRLKAFFDIFEKTSSKESEDFKKLFEHGNLSLLNDNIRITETLTVKDGFIHKYKIRYINENNDIVSEIFYELNGAEDGTFGLRAEALLRSTSDAYDCKDTEPGKMLEFALDIGGKADSSTADVHINWSMGISGKMKANIGYDIKTDMTKETDNFELDCSVRVEDLSSNEFSTAYSMFKCAGDIKQTPDSVKTKLKFLGMEITDTKDNTDLILALDLDASTVYTKDTPEDVLAEVSMPEEKVDVVLTKMDDWKNIAAEIGPRLQAIGSKIESYLRK